MTSDVLNGAFLQRLHHYALTAVEQGLILIDKEGIVRWSKALGPLENITDNKTLLETIARTCPPTRSSAANPSLSIAKADTDKPIGVATDVTLPRSA